MITPAYSPTATERVLPRLALDFTTGVLDPRVTVTRALNTATRVNSSGFIEAVNADLPRFDYDPVTLAPKGLLIEEARTNFVLQSNTLTAGTGVSVTAAAATSPDGTTNAYRVAKTDATTPRYSSNGTSMTVAANTAYTVSRFVKYDGFDTTVSLEYNNTVNWGGVAWNAQFAVASTGVTVSSQNNCTATVTNFGNGWYRITATFTTGATITTPSNPSFLMRITGASGVTVLGYGAQFETGAFATSYIPTTTTSVTRNADAVSMTGTNFSSWYNSTAGTMAASYSTFAPASFTPIVFSLNDNTTNNRIDIFNGGSAPTYTRGYVATAGVAQASMDTSPAVSNGSAAIAYSTNNFGASVSGAATVIDAVGTVPTVTQLQIGRLTSALTLNGYIRSIRYWPQRLTNAELQAFSK